MREYLENVFEEQLHKIVPESLKDSFEHDFGGLVSATRQQMELKRKLDPNYEPDFYLSPRILPATGNLFLISKPFRLFPYFYASFPYESLWRARAKFR